VSITMSPANFGYLLIALGIIYAAGAAFAIKKQARIKPAYLLFVPISIGLGIKFALGL
jgi:hypothetical protein